MKNWLFLVENFDSALAPPHKNEIVPPIISEISVFISNMDFLWFCILSFLTLLHFVLVFEGTNSILVWQRMLIKHMPYPPVLVNLWVGNCYIWQAVYKYCHPIYCQLKCHWKFKIIKRESPYLRRAVGAHGSNRSLQSGNSGRYTPDSGLFQNSVQCPSPYIICSTLCSIQTFNFETIKRPIWTIELRRQEGFWITGNEKIL